MTSTIQPEDLAPGGDNTDRCPYFDMCPGGEAPEVVPDA